jgi:23S rRNA pseudouridine1911/1915/1917 synthase
VGGAGAFFFATKMPDSLLEWLVRKYPKAKRQTLRRMVRGRRVLVDGEPARNVRQILAPNAKIEVLSSPRLPLRVKPSSLDIVYEDADLLVVNKPPGLLTSTVPGERRSTLLVRVEAYLAEAEPRARVGLIHRLDRDASGLLIFSKNDRAYQSLKTQFYQHTVEREYAVVVHGIPAPASDRISSRLVERADGIVYSTRQRGRGELAVTDYEVVETRGDRSLLRVMLQTGKKHQIRVHLSVRGNPVVGDVFYGSEKQKAGRLLLMARRLAIAHPGNGKQITFELPLPREFKQP